MQIRGDQAVEKTDEDRLVRRGFAENLANAILSWKSEGSICMALHGPWGSGKTSVINMCLETIVEAVKEKPEGERPIIMRFLPWMILSQEQLVRSFLFQLKSVLGNVTTSEHAKVAARLLDTYETILGVAGWIPIVGEYADKAKEFVAKAKGVAEAVGKTADFDLDGTKKLVCESLAKLPAPLIIVVDDVDRLTDREIRQLFQLIKAVADFPNTLYLLAYDHNAIDKSLAHLQQGTDIRFIEKIVQLDFEIPNPSRSVIGSYLWEELSQIVDETDFSQYEIKRWNEVKFGALPSLFINMREAKRFLNAVSFKYPLIKGEVSTVDLLLLEAFRMFAPQLHEAIKESGEVLLTDSPKYQYERQRISEERKKWITSLPDLVPERRRDAIQQLLCHLFPVANEVFNNRGYGYGFIKEWDKSHRICLLDYFDYYFQASLPDGQVSERETTQMFKLIDNPKALSLALGNYIADRRIEPLLDKLVMKMENELSPEIVIKFAVALSEAVEEIREWPRGMLSIPLSWSLYLPVVNLIGKLPDETRYSTLVEILQNVEKAVWLPVCLVKYTWEEWHPEEPDKAPEQKLLTEEEAEAIKEVTLDFIEQRADVLYHSFGLCSILWVMKTWGKMDLAKQWVENIIADERKIPTFIERLGGYSASGGLESNYYTSVFSVNISDVKNCCDAETLSTVCQRLLQDSPDWLDGRGRAVIESFLRSYNKQGKTLVEALQESAK